MIKTEIADRVNLSRLSNFYAQIPEYGINNILSNKAHLIWKHLENPYGKSQLFFELFENQIISVIVLQQRPSFGSKNFKYFLACDMAILPEFRKLSRFTNLWKEIKTFCNREFGNNYVIFHSSNNMSEPLYSSLPISKKVNILKPFLFFPGINLKYIFRERKSLNKIRILKEEQFSNWRFHQNSQLEYFDLYGIDDCYNIGKKIKYRIQKFSIFKCLIFLNDATSLSDKCDFKLQIQIIKAMIRHRCLVSILYAPQNLDKTFRSFFKFWYKIPNKLSPYTFPIYSSNFTLNYNSNKFEYFFLEDLDVL